MIRRNESLFKRWRLHDQDGVVNSLKIVFSVTQRTNYTDWMTFDWSNMLPAKGLEGRLAQA